MTSISAYASAVSAAIGGVTYDLTLGLAGDIDAEVDADNGDSVIRVYGDLNTSGRQGEVWASNPGGAIVQFEASTNWIIPNTDATEEDWRCRYTSLTGDTGELSGNGVDTWIDLSVAVCEIRLDEPGEPDQQFGVDGVAEIRIGTGAVLVSATFNMNTESAEKKKKGQ